MRKYVILMLIAVLALSSLMIINPSKSQITKPSVPEFTVQLTDRSYDEPPRYQTDPYTGETKLTWVGGHVENKTFDFTIKNQPFTPYKDSNGNYIELYYKIRHKGHFEEWSDSLSSNNIDTLKSSSSEYTLTSFIVSKNPGWGWDISANGIVDIQVKALIGYYSLVDDPYDHFIGKRAVFTTVGESDWSSTQTITIGSNVSTPTPTTSPTSTTPVSPSQSPYATPLQPNTQSDVLFGLSWEQAAVVVLGVLVAVLATTLVYSLRKRAKQPPSLVES
jgi:hypothetical protein